jgi:hypothetical protein
MHGTEDTGRVSDSQDFHDATGREGCRPTEVQRAPLDAGEVADAAATAAGRWQGGGREAGHSLMLGSYGWQHSSSAVSPE